MLRKSDEIWKRRDFYNDLSFFPGFFIQWCATKSVSYSKTGVLAIQNVIKEISDKETLQVFHFFF